MYTTLIKNAHIIDGTGSKPMHGDLAIASGKIVAIAPVINSSAHEIINANGKVLAPGFIDIQNHSDSHLQIFDNPTLDSMTTQGFTTILVGNSGASLAPLISPQALLSLQKWHSLEGVNINWRSFAEFAQAMKASTYGCNIASLVGYSTLRRGLIGDRLTPLSIEELQTLKQLASDAMAEGAFGVSTGLSYAHELNISEIELYELAKVVANQGGLMSVHLRNEGSEVVESVREVITIAQQANANLKIANLKIRNEVNWPLLTDVIAELETAWHRGVKIHFDSYPYTSTWQPLYTYLPTWAIQGGRLHMLEQLRTPIQRNKILTWLNNSETNIKNLIIASTSNNLHVTGKNIGSVAADMGTSSEEAMLRMIENGGSEILTFDENMKAEDVQVLMEHPLGFVATNGSGYSLDGYKKLVHPRCIGSASKYLRDILDAGKLDLPHAIRKLTTAPAEKIGLTGLGKIAIDYAADLVLFDPQTINNKSTLKNPMQYSIGIEAVWVNGQRTVINNQPTGIKAGNFLIRRT